MPSTPETMSIKEAAEALDVHPNTIRNYLAKAYLGYVPRPSGQRRVVKADVLRLRREMFAGASMEFDQEFTDKKLIPDPDGTETIRYMK